MTLGSSRCHSNGSTAVCQTCVQGDKRKFFAALNYPLSVFSGKMLMSFRWNWKKLMWGHAISFMNNPISWINGFIIGPCLMHIMPCQKMSHWGISWMMRTQALTLKYQFLCIYYYRLFTWALAENSFNLCLFDWTSSWVKCLSTGFASRPRFYKWVSTNPNVQMFA